MSYGRFYRNGNPATHNGGSRGLLANNEQLLDASLMRNQNVETIGLWILVGIPKDSTSLPMLTQACRLKDDMNVLVSPESNSQIGPALETTGSLSSRHFSRNFGRIGQSPCVHLFLSQDLL